MKFTVCVYMIFMIIVIGECGPLEDIFGTIQNEVHKIKDGISQARDCLHTAIGNTVQNLHKKRQRVQENFKEFVHDFHIDKLWNNNKKEDHINQYERPSAQDTQVYYTNKYVAEPDKFIPMKENISEYLSWYNSMILANLSNPINNSTQKPNGELYTNTYVAETDKFIVPMKENISEYLSWYNSMILSNLSNSTNNSTQKPNGELYTNTYVAETDKFMVPMKENISEYLSWYNSMTLSNLSNPTNNSTQKPNGELYTNTYVAETDKFIVPMKENISEYLSWYNSMILSNLSNPTSNSTQKPNEFPDQISFNDNSNLLNDAEYNNQRTNCPIGMIEAADGSCREPGTYSTSNFRKPNPTGVFEAGCPIGYVRDWSGKCRPIVL